MLKILRYLRNSDVKGIVMKVQSIKTLVLAMAAMLLGSFAMAQGYSIQSGDTLTVEVLEDPSLNRSVLVLPDGTISFPFAGSVRASGRTSDQVQSAIASGIASQFATSPTVFVTVQTLRARSTGGTGGGGTIDVYVIGQVNDPGEKSLSRGTTLLQALATTGGFSKFAATKRILLRRTTASGKQSVSRINYKAIADGSEIGNDVVLRDGDVIIVPERRLFE